MLYVIKMGFEMINVKFFAILDKNALNEGKESFLFSFRYGLGSKHSVQLNAGFKFYPAFFFTNTLF